jgi:hypothetical protein
MRLTDGAEVSREVERHGDAVAVLPPPCCSVSGRVGGIRAKLAENAPRGMDETGDESHDNLQRQRQA